MPKLKRRERVLLFYDGLPTSKKVGVGIGAYLAVFYLTLAIIDIFSIVLMFLMLFSLAAFLTGILNRKEKQIFRGLWLCAFTFSIFFIANKITGYQMEFGRRKAESIANQLELFRAKNGKYPDSTDSVGIENVSFNYGFEKRRIRYRLNEKGSAYCLRFYVEAWLMADYCSDNKKWVVDD